MHFVQNGFASKPFFSATCIRTAVFNRQKMSIEPVPCPCESLSNKSAVLAPPATDRLSDTLVNEPCDLSATEIRIIELGAQTDTARETVFSYLAYSMTIL